ncbi:MAG: hypothetical protein ACRD96_15730 [Bryobacteraceae bacterium]
MYDLNDLIATISGYSQMLLLNPGLDDRSRRYVEEIGRATDRATALVKRRFVAPARSVSVTL